MTVTVPIISPVEGTPLVARGLLDRTDSLVYSAPPVLGYLLLVGWIG